MKTIFPKLYNFCLHTVKVLSLLLLTLLSLSALLCTSYAEDMTTQQALIRWDNPLLCIPATALAGLLFLSLSRIFPEKLHRGKQILLGIVFAWILLLGCALILFGKTVPAADAMSVYSAAEALSRGDVSVIHPTESYLSYYPQQVGLMAFLELLHRLWNLFGIHMPAYHFIKGVYVLLLCTGVFFQYKSVHLLWEDDGTDCLYLLMAGANLPFIMYSSFVYGEIPSFTAFSVGLYFLFLFLKNTQPTSPARCLQGLACLLSLTLCVMLRKNALILIIAVIIVLVLESLKHKDALPLLLALLCLLCSVSILPLTKTFYEHRADNTIASGVTPLSYLAMGMQEASRGNGWYNGFNFETYQSTGMDTERTNEISRQMIAERLEYFQNNPGYAASFYRDKFLTQWTDGTYASRQATLATFGGRSAFFHSLYAAEGSRFYIAYCNIFQNLLYLGSLIFCLAQCFPNFLGKKRSPLADSPNALSGLSMYLGSIAVLGGFLFHMIWEANSRYIFIYGLLLMPYAARGLTVCFYKRRLNSTSSPA